MGVDCRNHLFAPGLSPGWRNAINDDDDAQDEEALRPKPARLPEPVPESAVEVRDPLGHLRREKWTALSGPLSVRRGGLEGEREGERERGRERE